MLQSILAELRASSVISVMDLANKLGTDRQSVMAALEQLQRMGYIIDMTKLSCGKRSFIPFFYLFRIILSQCCSEIKPKSLEIEDFIFYGTAKGQIEPSFLKTPR